MELLTKADLRDLLALARDEYFKQLGMFEELKRNPDKSEIDDAFRYQRDLVGHYERLCSRLVCLLLAAEQTPEEVQQ